MQNKTKHDHREIMREMERVCKKFDGYWLRVAQEDDALEVGLMFLVKEEI